MALASSVTIEIAGQEIKDFLTFSIDQKMHDLQEFTVSCRMDTFENPDDSVLNASKNFIGSVAIIRIETFTMGWQETSPGFLFKGFIHSVKAVKSETNSEDLIILQGYSPEYLLKNHPGCRSFENKSLKQIIETVLKPYPRDILATNVNPTYSELIPFCVKYNENCHDFLKRMAARYGEWMYYNGKEFIFGNASGNKEDLVLGKDLKTLDFSINIKAAGFKYISYDYMKAEPIEKKADKNMGKAQLNELGKIALDTSWKQIGQIDSQYFPHLNVQQGSETKAQNTSVEMKAAGTAMGMCGINATSENMNLVPGSKITVTEPKMMGTGEINYGEYIITSIQHECDNLMNYKNSFTAIPAETQIPEYTNPELVPQSAPQSAVVTNNNDPEKLGRVKVNFFWQESNQETPWLRTVSPYAASERGFFFIPEIDDEVLIGFDAGNAERPFVMGSLYNGVNKPHSNWPNSKNSFKGIATQSGLRLEFDEEKKTTTIDTPAGNKIVISDDEKSILLSDENMNKVEMSPDGIVLDSMKDISINSKSKIILDATAGVEISSVADVKVSGLNIDQNADMSFKANGGASATLEGGGSTTIKGALVMIN
jgi:uncharacterized protein involved in type VI secretion and phage assembly